MSEQSALLPMSSKTVNGLYKADLIHTKVMDVGQEVELYLAVGALVEHKRLEALDYAPHGNRNRVLSHPAHQHRAVKKRN